MNHLRTLIFACCTTSLMTLSLWSTEDIIPEVTGVVNEVPLSAFSGDNYFTTDAPQQTGKARRSSPILYSGLYQLPSDLENGSGIYNVGQPLSILEKDGSRYCFVRGVDDYYTNRNYIWAAIPDEFSIEGVPGLIPIHSKINEWMAHDGVDAILGEDGLLTKIFRDHRDQAFDDYPIPSSRRLKKGPIWKTKLGNIEDSFSYTISLNSIHTRLGEAEDPDSNLQKIVVKFGYYDISTDNVSSCFMGFNHDFVSTSQNNNVVEFPLSTSKEERVMTAVVPLSYLGESSSPNSVDLTIMKKGSGGHFRYDFTELYVPCLKTSTGYLLVDRSKQDGTFQQKQLLVEVEPSSTDRYLKIKDALFALEISSMGQESFLESTPEGFRIPANNEITYVYFSDEAKVLPFSKSKTLTPLDVSAFDYVAIAQKDANYFTNYRDDRPTTLDLAKLWDREDDTISGCMSAVYRANLFNTWMQTTINEQTISDVLIKDGNQPTLVSLEDVVDIYGGGLVSPRAIENFLNLSSSSSIKNVCLVGGTSVDTKKRQTWNDDDHSLFVQTLGVPSKLYYGSEYLGFIYSDDCYAGASDQRIERSVGRIPVFTDAGLKAWLEKRIVYQPGESINLIAGEVQPAGSTLAFPFDQEQKMFYGAIPSLLMTVKKELPRIENEQFSASNLARKWRESIAADVALSFYQGHGTISFLSEFNAEILTTKFERSKPSCFVLATCDTGKYYKGLLDESSSGASLTYMLMTGKKAGDLNQSVLETSPDSQKGAVNLIASTGFTGAVWENIYTRAMIQLIRETDHLTWGELLNCKYDLGLNSIEDVKAFQLFGDPALPVQRKNRKEIVMKDVLLKDQLPFQLKGEWSEELKADLTWQVGLNDGVVTDWEIKKYPVFTDDLSNDFIDLSSTNLTNGGRYQVRLLVGYSVGDSILPLALGASPTFYVDQKGPLVGKFVTPSYLEDIKTFSVRCEVADFKDEIYDGTLPLLSRKPTAYRFLLKQNDSPYHYFDSGLVNDSAFTFDTRLVDYEEIVRYNGLFVVSCYAYDQFGNASSKFDQYIYLRKDDPSFTDSDGDRLDDYWETNTFGNLIFSDGHQDSNDSGLTDRESYLADQNAYEFSLKLVAGWNLISIPCQISSEVANTLKSNISTVFYYDADVQYYKVYDFNKLLQSSSESEILGLWAFSLTDLKEPIKFKGSSPLENPINFKKDWNLFGYRRLRIVPQNSLLGATYEWVNKEYNPLLPTELIRCLKGYWVHSQKDL